MIILSVELQVPTSAEGVNRVKKYKMVTNQILSFKNF